MFRAQGGTSKKGVDQERNAEKRQTTALTLRKQKRDEQLEKKRRENAPQCEASNEPLPQLHELPMWVQEMNNPDPAKRQVAVAGIRRLLSTGTEEPPVAEVVQTPGALEVLMKLLQDGSNPGPQLEAAWALTNIASGDPDYTAAAVNVGCIPVFGELMASPDEALREQALWAIGNFAAERELRDQLLAQGYMNRVIAVIAAGDAKIKTVKTATWTVANLCRGRPLPALEPVRPCIPVLAQLLHLCPDEEVLTDALWALSYICDGDEPRNQAVLDANVLGRIITLLGYSVRSIQSAALRIIGNIVSGEDRHTQQVIAAGVLPKFHFLLESPNAAVRKSTLWALSNVTAGTPDQIQAVIRCGLIPVVLKKLEDEFAVRKEACWVLCNACARGTAEQVRFLVEEGCIPPLVDILRLKLEKITKVALTALDHILMAGAQIADTTATGVNPSITCLEACGGLDVLYGLQELKSDSIVHKTQEIIKKHFEFDMEHTAATDVGFSLDGAAAGAGNFSM